MPAVDAHQHIAFIASMNQDAAIRELLEVTVSLQRKVNQLEADIVSMIFKQAQGKPYIYRGEVYKRE